MVTREPCFALSAHLSLLYPELSFLGRIDAAAADGFEWVEFWDTDSVDPALVADRLSDAGLRVALINVSPGPERDACGRMGDPEAVDWWRNAFLTGLRTAELVGARAVNLLAGRSDRPSLAHVRTLVDNLTWAVRERGEREVELVVEPLNLTDRPGYLLPSCAAARCVLARAGIESEVGLLFDAYHVARSGGQPGAVFAEHQDAIRHVQLADAPGRHEPGTGAIDFGALFAALRAAGYDRPIGLEYEPASGHGAGLDWSSRLGLTHGRQDRDVAAEH